jgi:glycerophosphoryl diester phosphodiesterase
VNPALKEPRNRILAHRGIWNSWDQNSYQALSQAFEQGYGVETDIRLSSEVVVLAHDPIGLESATSLNSILPEDNIIALNIKMDGILPFLDLELLENSNYFFFDGSLPEMYKYKKAGLNIACRVSEFEPELPWEPNAIWLDSFLSDWWAHDDTLTRLSEKLLVVVVSPELHGRDKEKAWVAIGNEIGRGNPNLAICTDFPREFEDYVA